MMVALHFVSLYAHSCIKLFRSQGLNSCLTALCHEGISTILLRAEEQQFGRMPEPLWRVCLLDIFGR